MNFTHFLLKDSYGQKSQEQKRTSYRMIREIAREHKKGEGGERYVRDEPARRSGLLPPPVAASPLVSPSKTCPVTWQKNELDRSILVD